MPRRRDIHLQGHNDGKVLRHAREQVNLLESVLPTQLRRQQENLHAAVERANSSIPGGSSGLFLWSSSSELRQVQNAAGDERNVQMQIPHTSAEAVIAAQRLI